jgi:phospholipase/carboxylesterase
MQPKHLSLVHLIQPTGEQSPGQSPLLLLLHGVGSHEGGLFELAPYLDRRFFVVSARAPITLAPGSYAWFHVEFTPTGSIINPEEAESSRQLLLRFIDELVEAYGLDSQRVYLMGFSQGAIMSFSVALTRPDKVAGIVAMSGRILPEIRPLIAPPEQLKDLPILVVHGTNDNVLSIENGRASQKLLSKLPVELDYREYWMGHTISAESLARVSTWLAERLNEGLGTSGF